MYCIQQTLGRGAFGITHLATTEMTVSGQMGSFTTTVKVALKEFFMKEFATRGGTKSQGYKYSGSNNLAAVAWYDDNNGSETHPVMSKSPNELSIYDMSGNVWEWAQSCWRSDYNASEDCSSRVDRGGRWLNYARNCRVSVRYYGTPDFLYCSLGLRLAL